MVSDLAHPAEHLDVAVRQGVYTGGQGLRAGGEAADPVLEPPHIAGQIGGITDRGEGVPHRRGGLLNAGHCIGHARVLAEVTADIRDLIEEPAVAERHQDLCLGAELGALWCGGAPRRGVEAGDERLDHSNGRGGLLGQRSQARSVTQSLIDGGCGRIELSEQRLRVLQCLGGRLRPTEYAGQRVQSPSQCGVELAQPGGELIGSAGESGEIVLVRPAVGDGSGHLVADTAVLPRQLRLVESPPGRAGHPGDCGDARHLGNARRQFVEVGQALGGPKVGLRLHEQKLADDSVFGKMPVQQLVT